MNKSKPPRYILYIKFKGTDKLGWDLEVPFRHSIKFEDERDIWIDDTVSKAELVDQVTNCVLFQHKNHIKRR